MANSETVNPPAAVPKQGARRRLFCQTAVSGNTQNSSA